MEDDATRLVWVTMLAMKDRHGEVMGSVPGLANVARVPVDACRAAIKKFLSPDPDSRTADYEGRRIEAIQGGWAVLNHDAYRDLDSDNDRKQKGAIRQQRFRLKRQEAQRAPDPGPTPDPCPPSDIPGNASPQHEGVTSQRYGVTNDASSAMQMQMQMQISDAKAVKSKENTLDDSGESAAPSARSKRFVPPTVAEVADYAKSRGHDIDAERFVAHWEAVDWMRGKNKASKWRALVSTWILNQKTYKARAGGPQEQYFAPDPPTAPDYEWALQQIAEGQGK